jgi:hypothetical protein
MRASAWLASIGIGPPNHASFCSGVTRASSAAASLRRAAVLPDEGGQQRRAVVADEDMRVDLRRQADAGNAVEVVLRRKPGKRGHAPVRPVMGILLDAAGPGPRCRIGRAKVATIVSPSKSIRTALTAPVPMSIPIRLPGIARRPTTRSRRYGFRPGRSSIVSRHKSGRGDRDIAEASGHKQASPQFGGRNMRSRSRVRSARNWLVGGLAVAVASIAGAAVAQPKVAVITPYLAQPGTQFYVEGFQAAAGERAGT